MNPGRTAFRKHFLETQFHFGRKHVFDFAEGLAGCSSMTSTRTSRLGLDGSVFLRTGGGLSFSRCASSVARFRRLRVSSVSNCLLTAIVNPRTFALKRWMRLSKSERMLRWITVP